MAKEASVAEKERNERRAGGANGFIRSGERIGPALLGVDLRCYELLAVVAIRHSWRSIHDRISSRNRERFRPTVSVNSENNYIARSHFFSMS